MAPTGLSSSSLSGPEHHSSPLYGCFRSSTQRRLLRGATSAQAGRGQPEHPETPGSFPSPVSQMPHPRGHCPGHGGPFASPWPPPRHHLFLISLYSPAACLPSPTQHQAQHNPQPQLVLIRAGGGGGNCCSSSRPQCLHHSSHQPGYQEVPGKCEGLLLTPEHLPLPLWGLWWESRRGMRLTDQRPHHSMWPLHGWHLRMRHLHPILRE